MLFRSAVDDGMLYLTYTAQDYSGILNTAAVFVNGQEELDFVPGNDAAYNEETGEYSVVLPVETYQDGQMNEIALTCMDYAFNGTTDILYTNARLDAAVMFSNINNDDSLTVLRDISYSADYDYIAESYVNITDCVAQIRGIASSSVRRLTVNGQEIPPEEHAPIQDGDVIGLGDVEVTFTAITAAQELEQAKRRTRP